MAKGWLVVTPPPNDDSLASDEPDGDLQLRPRPPVLAGSTSRVRTPVGTAFVTVNSDVQGNVREVFVTVGRAGSDIAADAEAIGRLISLACRIPTSLPPRQVVDAVIDQLAGIGGSSSLGFGAHRVRSLADAVARVLAEHSGIAPKIGRASHVSDVEDQGETEGVGVSTPVRITESRRTGDFCPSCGQMNLVNEEGCRKCYGCGYSNC